MAHKFSSRPYKSLLRSALEFAGILLIVTLVMDGCTPYDSTDNREGKDRSGLALYIDNLTGCHYVKGGIFGGTTPRLDEEGNHICVGYRYE